MNQDLAEKFEKIIEHLKHELSALRIGRASAALVENIVVESYGQRMPLVHVASITIPDPRTIAIQPWDKSTMASIEKALQSSNLGINPTNDGILIRLTIPQMTEERRKEMVKVVGQIVEQSRVAVRNIREEAIRVMKTEQEENQITEDDLEKQKKDLQTKVDGYNNQIKDISTAKEKEIMTI